MLAFPSPAFCPRHGRSLRDIITLLPRQNQNTFCVSPSFPIAVIQSRCALALACFIKCISCHLPSTTSLNHRASAVRQSHCNLFSSFPSGLYLKRSFLATQETACITAPHQHSVPYLVVLFLFTPLTAWYSINVCLFAVHRLHKNEGPLGHMCHLSRSSSTSYSGIRHWSKLSNIYE